MGMEQDGVNPSFLDLSPDAPVPSETKLKKEKKVSTIKLKDSEKYAKYFKMLKMKIPPGAVKNKMEKDGVNPAILDLGPDALEPLEGEEDDDDEDDDEENIPVLLLKNDPAFSKYFKMLDVGL